MGNRNFGLSFFKAGFSGFWHGLFNTPINVGTVTGDFKTASVLGLLKAGTVSGDFATASVTTTIQILVEKTY